MNRGPWLFSGWLLSGLLLLGTLAVLAVTAPTALAQTQQQLAPAQQPQPQTAPPQQNPPPAPPEQKSGGGLVDELGKIIKDSASSISSTFQSSRDALDNLNSRTIDATKDVTKGAIDATKGAGDTITRAATQTMVSGRSACPVAANGAPDCKSASAKLCKDKGYKDGSSLDIESAEKCSAKVYLSGRTGAPGECKTENYVTRAVCQ